MRIGWITFGAPTRKPDGGLTSDIASLRYRVLAPISQLSHASFSHRIFPVWPHMPDGSCDAALESDLLIFSKSFAPANEGLAERAKVRGIPVIFDVCDNHYQHPQYGPHYRAMSALADQVVCNTPQMAEIATAFCNALPVVIGDPYEGPRQLPIFSPGPRLKLLWFGHPSNLDSLQAAIDDLMNYAKRQPISLNVLTRINPALIRACENLNASADDRFRMTVESWSLDGQWQALAACDAVVIPSLSSDRKQVKSANRMVESLWAGKPVIAQFLASYEAFRPWTEVGEILSAGLDGLMANAKAAPALVQEAQDYIETTFAPSALGNQWRDVMMLCCPHGTMAP